MFTKKYILDLLERVIRSFAGGYAAQGVVGNAAIFSVDSLKFGLAAAGASFLLALASKPFGNTETASILPE